jgi:putative oxidoreductase
MIRRLLFPAETLSQPLSTSLGLLTLRLGAGLLIMVGHGWGKLSNYSTMVDQWADPIGLGSAVSLSLAVFAEFFCSIAVTLGFLTRAAVIPLLVTMLVAAFIVHGDDPFQKKELALLFLTPFLALLLAGPGRFSLDAVIGRRLKR